MTDLSEGKLEFSWDIGVFDAHCHPTDSMAAIDDIPSMKTQVLTIMATRAQDQELVSNVADEVGLKDVSDLKNGNGHGKVLPSFGWHPWFSHHIRDDTNELAGEKINKVDHYKEVVNPSPDNDAFLSSLPEPRSLTEYIAQTRAFLQKHPLALVGEIGLDRAFRIPDGSAPSQTKDTEPGLTPGGREGRRLSPYRVDLNHQRKILTAQLTLAGELQRAVSVHGVGAHGVLFETLQSSWKGHEREVISRRNRKRRGSVAGAHDDEESPDSEDERKTSIKAAEKSNSPKPYPPRICLHSYSGPPEQLRQYLHSSVPADIFFSFSQVINFSSPASVKAVEVIKAVPKDRLLVESDLHCAGDRMDDLLEDMVRSLCKIRGWGLEEGLYQLARNWKHFALGLT